MSEDELNPSDHLVTHDFIIIYYEIVLLIYLCWSIYMYLLVLLVEIPGQNL